MQGPDDFSNDPYYWQDQIFRTGVTHDLNLNIAGQTKGYDYAISGGYLNQEGIVEGSDYTRYTIKLNLNRQVKDWLKVGTSISVHLQIQVLSRLLQTTKITERKALSAQH